MDIRQLRTNVLVPRVSIIEGFYCTSLTWGLLCGVDHVRVVVKQVGEHVGGRGDLRQARHKVHSGPRKQEVSGEVPHGLGGRLAICFTGIAGEWGGLIIATLIMDKVAK